jgi:hypothetical protein
MMKVFFTVKLFAFILQDSSHVAREVNIIRFISCNFHTLKIDYRCQIVRCVQSVCIGAIIAARRALYLCYHLYGIELHIARHHIVAVYHCPVSKPSFSHQHCLISTDADAMTLLLSADVVLVMQLTVASGLIHIKCTSTMALVTCLSPVLSAKTLCCGVGGIEVGLESLEL